MKSPRSWISGIAASLLVLGSVALCSHRAPLADRGAATAQKGSFEIRVEAIGVLDAARGFQVTSTMRGDRGKIVHLADDGAPVSPGDVLLRFDATPFEIDIQKLTGELRGKEAMVEFARQNLEVEKSQVKKTLDNGEYDLLAARQEHGRFQAYIDDLAALARKGYSVEGEIAQARRKEEQLRTTLLKSETELGRLSREAVYSVAKAAAELNKAESEVASVRASLATAREELAKTEVRAPSAGFVVLHEVFQGNSKRRPRAGDTIWQGQPVLYLPDLSAMIVKTQVREEDLHKLHPGQLATVRVDAYPDARFEGSVASVGVLAVETPGANVAGKFFQLGIDLHGADARLRPGMTARVSIVSERVSDALVIPVTALHYEGGEPVCFVFDGNAFAARPVTIGRRSEDLLEVLGGLKAGERVSLTRP